MPKSNPLNKIFVCKFFVYLLGASLLLSACHKNDDQASSMKPMVIPVSTIALKSTSVPVVTEVVGETEGAKEVEIRPRVAGIVLKKLYSEGAPIKQGQPMFQIDPVPFELALDQAKANYHVQFARTEQAIREESRLKAMLKTSSISQRDYDNALSDKQAAMAALNQARAQVDEASLNLSYTKVTAPISGIAGRFMFSEGALVPAYTSVLTSIKQLSPLWVRFSLSDSDIKSLGGHLDEHNVQSVNLLLGDGNTFNEDGKINYSASQIDPTLGTLQLRATFENKSNQLLPGQFVRVKLSTGQRPNVFLVPHDAVLTSDEGRFVFVAQADKPNHYVATIKPIKDAGWFNNQWVVTEGLKEGDQVIVDNLIKLKPGVDVLPHPPMPAHP
jgi:membrane fusion protein, multidrug efflux system